MFALRKQHVQIEKYVVSFTFFINHVSFVCSDWSEADTSKTAKIA